MGAPKHSNKFDPIKSRIDSHNEDNRTYVWELPVRIFHWINAFSILVLIATGFYIGNPFFSATVPEHASENYLMGWVRNIHFLFGYIFTLNLIVRLYWVFHGNKHAKSNPLKLSWWRGIFETLKYYLFMNNKKRHYIGHNPMAELSYWIFIGLGSIISISTGFYLLFEPQPESFYGKLFAWVPMLFGGESFSVRSWHHIVAWGFIIFTVVHLYMAIREDWSEKNGTLSSIFTGYKNDAEKKGNKDDN
ncbi:Ni/Fe-hydrogenase, b-type cytochrome subunit [Bacillus solimangrovi]|uniref:Ni/Fe-hydrogenase, b-type cytochrome subunit n=1 Tax=Bacillus solimangrovi TaxID=1305675 RepID=A0A1E5LFE9_9BACI|nr:Ni/Fe-hydrogenase, b-type cytochrome subunit [Bacillus solimangrovi]OEH92815.1 Ni/Fe-hydrogenase, b-type cytochrome subunit [Bacillus solimangrovi]